ncbi:MAG: LysR family transcriptional regulator [Candidatus Gastranaerophilaceae bacterium]
MGKPRTDTDACLDAGEIKEPALSRRLAALEEELGTKLFQRNEHGRTKDYC